MLSSALIVMAGVLAAEFVPPAELPEQEGPPAALSIGDGKLAQSPEEWQEYRSKLQGLFEAYVYGVAPPPPKIEATVDQLDSDLFGGKATLKQITLSFPELGDGAPEIHLALFVPNEKQPAPVILALNKCGNYSVLDYPGIRYYEETWRHDQCPPGDARGAEKDFWAIENMIDRGYAFATFHESDIDPDRDDFTDGIHPYYADLPGPKETHWGTIAAWAWGLQRCVDYLETDDAILDSGIIVTGHSRRGKTALWAGATDERIDIVVPLQSGTGGMALSRNNDQETVERINRVFPHWFNDVFSAFSDNESKLPVDQHQLVALVAPRPLLDIGGIEDKWANYESSLNGLKLADPVYELLGKPGLEGDGMAVDEEPIAGDDFGTIMQYRRNTGHTINADYWNRIIAFANLHLGR